MDILTWVLGAFFTFVILMQIRIFYKSKTMIGNSAPEHSEATHESGKALYYFYTPNCSACRVMAPVIDKLQEQFPDIVNKIDASSDTALAQKFNIMATPTTVFVKDGIIANVLLGAKREKDLADFLNS